jgi:hypothetical protein
MSNDVIDLTAHREKLEQAKLSDVQLLAKVVEHVLNLLDRVVDHLEEQQRRNDE